MQIEITGRHVEITEPIKSFVIKRLRKFTKLFIEPIDIHVILGIEKHRQSAEIVLKSKLFNLNSVEESTDMYNSISKAVEKIERQALKQKEKVIVSKRHQLAPNLPVPAPPTPKSRNRSDGNPVSSRVIVEDLARKKPMDLEEALIDLTSSVQGFVVYRDSESEGVHVLYRRRDGNIGLIRPE